MNYSDCINAISQDFDRTKRQRYELLVNDNLKLAFWFRIASYIRGFFALIPLLIYGITNTRWEY